MAYKAVEFVELSLISHGTILVIYYGYGLDSRAQMHRWRGPDDYVSVGDVAIRLIPDLLSRDTATV